MSRREDQLWQELVYKDKTPLVRGPAVSRHTTKAYFMRRFLELKSSDKLLDIGCGYGEFTLLAAGRVGAAIGVDAAATAVAVAREAAERLGVGNARFLAGDAYGLTELVGADGPFHKILCFDLLEHVSRPQEVVDQIHALLAPGGRALVYTNCHGRWSWMFLKQWWRTRGKVGPLWAPDERDHHLVRFTPAQLRRMTAGFATRLVFKNHFLIPLASFAARQLDRLYLAMRPPPPPAAASTDRPAVVVTVRTTMRAPRRAVEIAKLAVSILEMETLGRIAPAAGVYLLLEKK